MLRVRPIAGRLGHVVVLSAAAVGLGASPALAGTVTTVSQCSPPPLSQPFLAYGDQNYYTLAPGEKPNNFDGAGWTLAGGAKVVKTNSADGTMKNVLDLPSGSSAVSPTICVSSSYPTARTMVRNVLGSEGVSFSVSYENTPSWSTPQNTGLIDGSGRVWTLSDPVSLQPADVSGWQLVRFTFVAGGTASEFQLYNFYIDPYSKR